MRHAPFRSASATGADGVRGIVVGASVAIVAYLALVPLGFLVYESLRSPASASAFPRL